MILVNQHYVTAFRTQALHAALCLIWNGIGLWQINIGVPAIGPTASVLVMVVIGVLLALLTLCFYKNWLLPYLFLGSIAFLFAALAIYGGFTKAPELWPSEFWRVMGIVVNGVGVLGFLLMVKSRVVSGRAEKRLGV